jgi:curved DNA-binding protein CbpA
MTGDLDLYAVLGVRPEATAAEISHAYRNLVRRHHPDSRTDEPAAPGTSGDLEQVLAAYAVLRDPDRRADYDRRRMRQAPTPRRTRPTKLHVSYRGTPAPVAEPDIRVGPVRYHGPAR